MIITKTLKMLWTLTDYKMNIEAVKRNTKLLENITKQYVELLKKRKSNVQKKKMEAYIESLLMNIEKNIK